MRSKVKRSFGSKKRETRVYAASARLHGISSKLEAVATRDEEGDVPVSDAGDELGWSWLLIFGLVDHSDITAESMLAMTQCKKSCMVVPRAGVF